MSYGVSAVGRPQAVAAAIADQASRSKCSEPEESIKAAVVAIVQTAMAAFPEGSAVSVEACGSQSCIDYNDPSKGASNSLKVEIKPLFGFVE